MRERRKRMGTRDEDGDVNGDNVPEESREIVQKLKEILNRSEQEIYAMLVECDMDAGETVDRLLSQDAFQQVKSKRNKKKQIRDKSDSKSRRDGSNIQDRECSNGSDHYVGQGGENESNSYEMSIVQEIHNRLTDSSTTDGILGPIPNSPLNSDLTNVETKRVPVSSSGERVPFSFVPSSVSKENLLNDPSSNLLIESVSRSDQLQDAASVSSENLLNDPSCNLLIESDSKSNQNLRNGDYGDSSLLCDEDINKNGETYPLQRRSFEHNLTEDPSASVATDEPEASVKEDAPVLIIPSHLQVKTSELSHLKFGRFGCGQREDISEFADDLSFKHLNLRDDEFHKEEEQRLRRNVVCATQCEIHEPSQENQSNISSATDLTFDNSQWLNPVEAPSEPSLQMQNVDMSFDFMHQEAYKREPDPHYSAFTFNQSIPTEHSITSAPSLGRRPSVSMTEALRSACAFEPQRNQQAMNQHYSQPKVSSLEHYGNTVNYPHSKPAQNGGSNNNNYHQLLQDEHRRIMNLCRSAGDFGTLSGNTVNSQHEVPSGNYGNTLNYPHSQPTHNDMLLSAYNQNGVSNNNTYHQQSLAAAMLSQIRNSDMPQSAFTTTVPSAYGSMNDSANGFGMSNDDIANPRFGYDNVLNSQFNRSNHLPSIQHQNVNSNVQSGSDYYNLLSGRQNQQSLSLRQQEQQLYGKLDYERSSLYKAHMNQLNSRRGRRDQSNQTKQHPWDRNNY